MQKARFLLRCSPSSQLFVANIVIFLGFCVILLSDLNRLFCRHPRHRWWSCWQLRESACRGQGHLHAGDDAACPGHRSQRDCRHRHRLRDHRCQRLDADGSHQRNGCCHLSRSNYSTGRMRFHTRFSSPCKSPLSEVIAMTAFLSGTTMMY